MEPCQLSFNGKTLNCTYAFIQSINTRTMINYKYYPLDKFKDIYEPRTNKYIQRLFKLLRPRRYISLYIIFILSIYLLNMYLCFLNFFSKLVYVNNINELMNMQKDQTDEHYLLLNHDLFQQRENIRKFFKKDFNLLNRQTINFCKPLK